MARLAGMVKTDLRRGWTTGACAAAAARAAATALLSGVFPDPVTISLPRGNDATFAIAQKRFDSGAVTAGVVKDAGDDPDVTDGALVSATVRRAAAGAGVTFAAGEGVGTVTKPGLSLGVGEPAINPKPRELIAGELSAVARNHAVAADFHVTISVPGGEELARRTTNGRLGITGGLSILGTSGIVIPYSCAAWVHSIHRGIDVARAGGLYHIVVATGRTSERAAQVRHGLDQDALIEMGDFIGATLTYLVRHPIPRVTVAGGFGKLSKLADGHRDLHSSRSTVDVGKLTMQLAEMGATRATLNAARDCGSASAVLALAETEGLPLAAGVAARAREVALATLAGRSDVDVVVVDRGGRIVGVAGP